MASSAATTATSVLASPALPDVKTATCRQAPTHSVGLNTLPPPAAKQIAAPWKPVSYCRKVARDVISMASGGATAEVATELPEIVKTIQEAWDKVEDKYAVSSIAVAGFVALWGSAGMISAIDRLPVVPGVLEVVGIGFSGWFAYRNLIYKPDREALLAKVKSIYEDIIGTSS